MCSFFLFTLSSSAHLGVSSRWPPLANYNNSKFICMKNITPGLTKTGHLVQYDSMAAEAAVQCRLEFGGPQGLSSCRKDEQTFTWDCVDPSL